MRCHLKSTPPGYQELLVDIVVPNKEDYRYDLSLLDARTMDVRQLPKNESIPLPFQNVLAKALGTIEIRTRVLGGEYDRVRRSDLLVFGPWSGKDLVAIVVRDGFAAGLPGIVRVDLALGKKYITIADTTHLEGRLSTYEGTCE